MSLLHLKLKKPGSRGQRQIVAIDTEWAKNWKAADKFTPFCAAVHVLYPPTQPNVLAIDEWAMDTELYFRSPNEDASTYAVTIDEILRKNIGPNTTVVGHQITSDLHLLRRIAKCPLPTIDAVLSGFSSRRTGPLDAPLAVRDTRYDIRSRLVGNGEERLRSVSLRLGVFAVQTELDEMSLTKLYNCFREDGDWRKLEKLIVMNWRHAFQTALVWVVDNNPGARLINSKIGGEFLVTNDIILTMGYKKIEYLRSKEFMDTCTREGISDYVRKYAPEIAERAGL